MKRLDPIAALVLLFVSLPATGGASFLGMHPEAERVPTILSGTLSPLAVTVDGRRVGKPTGRTAARELRVNGVAIAPGEERERPFYHQADAESLRIEFIDESGALRQLADLRFPRILSVRREQGDLVMQLSAQPTSVRMDGAPIAFAGDTARWPIPAGEECVSTGHSVEIIGADAPTGSTYNLRFPFRMKLKLPPPAGEPTATGARPPRSAPGK